MSIFGVLVKFPFTKLTRTKGKDGILTNHAKNVYHLEASERAKAFINTYQHPQSRIDTCINIEAQRLSEANQHILSKIVQTILLLARQGLPLRSHRDDSTANPLANRGNFLALLEHTAARDPVLKEHLQRDKKNQKYISRTLQNEIILTAAGCEIHLFVYGEGPTSFFSSLCPSF